MTAQYALAIHDTTLAIHELQTFRKPLLVESDVGPLADVLRCRAEGKLDGSIAGWVARTRAIGCTKDRTRAFVELAVLARTTRSGREAAAVVAEALAQDEVDDVDRFRLLAERARLLLAARNLEACRTYLRDSIAVAESSGWTREHARLVLFYGTHVAAALGERPMGYIRVAATELAVCGTWRDRERLRDALREHGRRIEDRRTTVELVRRLGQADQEAATLRGLLLSGVDELVSTMGPTGTSSADGETGSRATWQDVVGVLRSSRNLVEVVKRTGTDLLELLARTLAERNQLVDLVQALSSLERFDDVGRIAQEAVRCATSLIDADRVVLAAWLPDERLEVLGCHPALEESSDDRWRTIVQEQRRTVEPARASWFDSPPPRQEMQPLGPVMVVPVVALPFEGVLYADKLLRAGTFRTSDRKLMALLGDHLGQVLARVRFRGPTAVGFVGERSPASDPDALAGIVPMAEVEKQVHLAALEACRGKVVMAAKALGVSKTQFYAKLHAWGYKTKQARGVGDDTVA